MTVSGWFSDSFLIWLTINLLFAWKPVVNTQRENINKVKEQIKNIVASLINKIDAFIPKYKDATIKTE